MEIGLTGNSGIIIIIIITLRAKLSVSRCEFASPMVHILVSTDYTLRMVNAVNNVMYF